MTWLKTDDGEWCHPWVSIAGPTAYGIYKRLEGYCAQHETDGLIPAEFVTMIVGSAGDLGPPALETLTTQGRVAPAPIGRGLLLPFFLDNNPTRAEIEATRTARSQAGRRGGKSSGDTRRSPTAKRPKITADMRRELARRHGARPDADTPTACHYCSEPLTWSWHENRVQLLDSAGQPTPELDHVNPLNGDGAHHIDNLVPACLSCNRTKGHS